ncbi:MAG: 3-phosphoshikimate 1-carboxyvinyltransferase [Planctomycetota bacterium]|nr:MAG: 3-phosphoshikimate 1-carboxyvinyltransferase [Planctomycetota bacterium]
MSATAAPRRVAPARRLHGAVDLPGDKSMWHRALILSALARGRSLVRGAPAGQDVASTRGALTALGVRIEDWDEGVYVDGDGIGAWRAPAAPIDCGNAGTTLRLLLGALAAAPLVATLTGDGSLRRRPMGRVLTPLERMGARFEATAGGADGRCAPITVFGCAEPRPLVYESPVASAQVKSAVLLCGLHAAGRTEVREPVRSRDHTERMLRLFGLDVREHDTTVTIEGPAELEPARVEIPGDVSAAAFWLVAAAGLEGSRVVLRDVGTNPTRTGVLDVLDAMGAELHRGEQRFAGFEPLADLFVRGGAELAPLRIEAAEVPRLVDEIPLLCLLATRAHGTSEVRGAGELRHKESDRLASTTALLHALGAECEPLPDGLRIPGPQRLRGGRVDPRGDHRIAMAAAVAGLWSEQGVEIADPQCVAVSYPTFFDTLEALAVR